MSLPNDIRRLLQAAAEVRRKAYAPYSGYRVGAAVLSPKGEVFTGVNVENASYGLTICAERSAVFNAVSAGARQISAVAIVADSEPLPWPCGACRQVMAEFAPPDCLVYVASASSLQHPEFAPLADLLPHSFGPGHLSS